MVLVVPVNNDAIPPWGDEPRSCGWRPLASNMQHPKNADRFADHIVDEDIVVVGHQFACTGDTASSGHVGVIDQTARLFLEKLVKSECRGRVFGFNVVIDDCAVFDGFGRPVQFHHSMAVILRRVAARRSENPASTCFAGIRFPALAESIPI